MRLQLRKPNQSLNKAYARQSVAQNRMDTFRRALTRLFARVNEKESEDYQKKSVAEFLNEAFDTESVEISFPEQIDLVIQHRAAHQDRDEASLPGKSLPGILIETRKVFAGEMMTPLKNNVRALHELILHYFDQQERSEEIAVRHLIVTDVYNWFIFDETDFRQFFYDNAKLKKLYQVRQQNKRDTAFFYAETARILRELDAELPVTYVNLREAADVVNLPSGIELTPDQVTQTLLPVFKLLSPEHLFKEPFANDANTFNQAFCSELLHIVGLRELTQGNRKCIQRLPEGERFDGSLLEQLIRLLRANNVSVDQSEPVENNRLVSIALELCMTWLSRILFLKLLEGQLIRYHKDDQNRQFLTANHIHEFGELNELFIDVMAVPERDRSAGIARFDQMRPEPIPYLNSSLFDLTNLERSAVKISALNAKAELPLFSETILKDDHGVQQTGQLPILQYLLLFLDAYDFAPDGPADVLPADRKPSINSMVLGSFFERLTGDSVVSTPDFISTYLIREAVSRAVITRFNDRFGWDCTDIQSLQNRIQDIRIADANAVVNSVRIVDSAVGSGRLLRSALNVLIALKAELGILVDRDGRHLNYYDISVVNDELLIATKDGETVDYYAPDHTATTRIGPVWTDGVVSETQRIQETIFHEKQTLIENCLFGVDRNPIAVSICRVRLWMELLKSVYYLTTPDGSRLCSLPNIDINIKVGNSLVSNFRLDFKVNNLRNPVMREKFIVNFKQYCLDVSAYKRVRNPVEKAQIRTQIQGFREFLNQIALVDRKDYADIRRLETKLAQSAPTFDFVNQDDLVQRLLNQVTTKKMALANKERMFQEAIEWRFEFPEVLDESANYLGFDVVISRPPYAQPEELDSYRSQYRKAFPNTYSNRANRYVMFVELGLNLLKPDGQLAYLLPTTWMQAAFGKKLRNWLKTKAIEQIVTFSELPVSDHGTVWPSLLIIRNADATGLVRMANVKTLRFTKTGLDLSGQLVNISVDTLSGKAWVVPKPGEVLELD